MSKLKRMVVLGTVFGFVMFALLLGNHWLTWLYLLLFAVVANLEE